jgi:hypothetical protein
MDTTMNDVRIIADAVRGVSAGIEACPPAMKAAKACGDNVTKLIYATLVGAILLAGSDRVAAQQSDQPVVRQVGDATKEWLQLQSSGAEASEPLPMLGAEATAAYRRYLDSFNSKIPPFFASSLQSQQGSSQGGGAN